MQPRTGSPHAMLVLLDEPPLLRCGTLNSSENCSSKFYKRQCRLSVSLCQGATEEELCQCDGHLFQGTCVQCETGTRHSVKISKKVVLEMCGVIGRCVMAARTRIKDLTDCVLPRVMWWWVYHNHAFYSIFALVFTIFFGAKRKK